MAWRPWTEAEIELIRTRHLAGVKNKTIAAELNREPQSISPVLKKLGLARPLRRGSFTDRIKGQYVVTKDGCWHWTGYVNWTGYGRMIFTKPKRLVLVHRLAWETWRGEIPEGLNVLHTCDNRRCFNPDHLWLGTHADNMADMVAKGRHHSQKGLAKPSFVEAAE